MAAVTLFSKYTSPAAMAKCLILRRQRRTHRVGHRRRVRPRRRFPHHLGKRGACRGRSLRRRAMVAIIPGIKAQGGFMRGSPSWAKGGHVEVVFRLEPIDLR